MGNSKSSTTNGVPGVAGNVKEKVKKFEKKQQKQSARSKAIPVPKKGKKRLNISNSAPSNITSSFGRIPEEIRIPTPDYSPIEESPLSSSVQLSNAGRDLSKIKDSTQSSNRVKFLLPIVEITEETAIPDPELLPPNNILEVSTNLKTTIPESTLPLEQGSSTTVQTTNTFNNIRSPHPTGSLGGANLVRASSLDTLLDSATGPVPRVQPEPLLHNNVSSTFAQSSYLWSNSTPNLLDDSDMNSTPFRTASSTIPPPPPPPTFVDSSFDSLTPMQPMVPSVDEITAQLQNLRSISVKVSSSTQTVDNEFNGQFSISTQSEETLPRSSSTVNPSTSGLRSNLISTATQVRNPTDTFTSGYSAVRTATTPVQSTSTPVSSTYEFRSNTASAATQVYDSPDSFAQERSTMRTATMPGQATSTPVSINIPIPPSMSSFGIDTFGSGPTSPNYSQIPNTMPTLPQMVEFALGANAGGWRGIPASSGITISIPASVNIAIPSTMPQYGRDIPVATPASFQTPALSRGLGPPMSDITEPTRPLIQEYTTNDNAAAKVTASRMPVTIYHMGPSPPCRAVRLTAKAIGLDLNLKIIDISKGEHMTPEYEKLNPTNTIPTMDDNGFVIWESRAILPYLVDMYAKDDSLYPKDPQARALVDQRLYFDIGTFYQKYMECYIPFLFGGANLDPEKLKGFEKTLGFFNTMLDGHRFAAGDHLTIADISIVPAMSNVDAFGYDLSQYPNVFEWYKRTRDALDSFGYDEINQSGANFFGQLYKSKMG